jgi:hypothetical protein
VDANAPSQSKPEKITFQPEAPYADPYRKLAEHYAPFLAQETWFQPKSDYPARFNFDGDWDGANNWESLDSGSSQAYVYYAVMETATHWFLIYNVPRRGYSDKCVVGTMRTTTRSHPDRLQEGGPYGRLQAFNAGPQ